MRPALIPFFLLTIFSCTKDKPDPYESTRDISGTVAVYNEFGVVSNDNIGVTVSLSDGSTKLTTTTIQNGKYTFSKVPYGKYILSVSRDGYGTNKRFGIQHQHPKDSANIPLELSVINLAQMCTSTITYSKAEGKPNGSLDFWLGISPSSTLNETRYYRIFISLDSLFAPEDADLITSPQPVTAGAGQSGNLSFKPITDFRPGTKAWIRIYGDVSPNTYYFDSTLNKLVFPCMSLNTGPSSSFIFQ